VTLNTVNPKSIRSVDLKTFQDLTLHTRRQSSRGSPFETFGLDISQDILRGVTGEPSDSQLARRLTGADALAIMTEAKVTNLGKLAGRLIAEYKKTDYTKNFGWIDQLQAVTDLSVISELNDALVVAINEHDGSAVQIGPPGPVEWEHISGFRYSSSP